MSVSSTVRDLIAPGVERRSTGKPLSRRRLLRIIPLTVLALVIVCAVFGPWLTLHDPVHADLDNTLRPPVWLDGGSWHFPLGTDRLGRDIFSRLIAGARPSAIVALCVIVLGGAVGSTLGILAGYFGGIVDAFLMRVVDAAFAIPTVFLALLLAATLGPSLGNVILIVSLVVWSRFARVVRGQVLSVKHLDYVALARVAGASPVRIMLRHIFPNVLNTILVLATLEVGVVIVFEASLSFLGAGIPPPAPVWGSMLASGRDDLAGAWWISTFSGLAILIVVLCINITGDWLRDRLDPQLRHSGE